MIATASAVTLLAFPVAAQQRLSAPRACPPQVSAATLSGGPVVCTCSPEAAQAGNVWGTDTYTLDSAACRAALHAGAITASGGAVTLLPAPGQRSYRGSNRNGVESEEYGAWDGSFRFARPGELTPEQIAAAAARCPTTLASDDPALSSGEPLSCICPASTRTPGEVWGSLVYTTDSSLCAAAVHAGAVDRRGGEVTIILMPGRRAYRGSARNGITSSAYGEWPSSFRFAGVAPPDPSLCPESIAEREDGGAGPLSCTCPSEQTMRGNVWGTGIYTSDSAICRAALHVGAITRAGGRVTVVPEPGQDSYRGSTRNGVQAGSWEEPWEGSIRFEGATASAAPAAPVQAPVAHSLRTLGQVQLYVQFRTNSAEIDPPAVPVLTELRDALRADPEMQVAVVGHTDNVGGPAANRPLSQRRAESVRSWLVGQGIEAGRLRAEGRGQDQPIAENNTEIGRALNRRVQITRVN
jgi:outer membrane protein OmpA-like peptidoglycan-associated protein